MESEAERLELVVSSVLDQQSLVCHETAAISDGLANDGFHLDESLFSRDANSTGGVASEARDSEAPFALEEEREIDEARDIGRDPSIRLSRRHLSEQKQ